MRIWRRGHIDVEHKPFLEENKVWHEPWLSVKNPEQVLNYMFVIYEDEPAWPEIKRRIGGGSKYYVGTHFTHSEIVNAEWCMARAVHSIKSVRHPSDYGWSEEFFHKTCRSCGVGWRQIAPLRIKREPKLGKNRFAGFGSAFEMFCTPEALSILEAEGIGGFETWPLLINKTGLPSQSLKQIMVTEMAGPAIAEELVERERYGQTDCPVCGRTWHAHYIRGMLPLRRSALIPEVGFQLTNEWFGNGRTARREILVSQKVVRLILKNKWKGIEFTPIHAV